MRPFTFLATALLASALLIPTAGAKPKAHAKRGRPLDVPTFYDREGKTIATVEFVQEYSAGGSRRQVRAFTDGVVISADGLVLISGRVRFPQQDSGRLSGGTLPELSGFRLYFADGREVPAQTVAFDNDLNLGVLKIAGPAPAPLLKAETFYRYQIMIRSRSMNRLSRILTRVLDELSLPEAVTVTIDVDPVNMA